jgi:hypothetical protein
VRAVRVRSRRPRSRARPGPRVPRRWWPGESATARPLLDAHRPAGAHHRDRGHRLATAHPSLSASFRLRRLDRGGPRRATHPSAAGQAEGRASPGTPKVDAASLQAAELTGSTSPPRCRSFLRRRSRPNAPPSPAVPRAGTAWECNGQTMSWRDWSGSTTTARPRLSLQSPRFSQARRMRLLLRPRPGLPQSWAGPPRSPAPPAGGSLTPGPRAPPSRTAGSRPVAVSAG